METNTLQVFHISDEAIGQRCGYTPFFDGFDDSIEDYRHHVIMEMLKSRKPEDIIDD